jgi:DNA mismatch endonuclease (patch repair protein)
MSKIRSRGNAATELRLIKFFRANKITGWRRNQKILGNPDFVFRKKCIVVFVDGCFWHGCSQHSRMPRSNRSYWLKKLRGNKKRDQKITLFLRRSGWRVMRIWQHELIVKNKTRLLRRLKFISS